MSYNLLTNSKEITNIKVSHSQRYISNIKVSKFSSAFCHNGNGFTNFRSTYIEEEFILS